MDSLHRTVKVDVAVIGAGISGLSTAHFLSRKGLSVQLIERCQRAGGVIQSSRINGFLLEHGPSSMLDTTPLLHQLVADLGLEQALEYANPAAQNRYIVHRATLVPLPLSPPAFLKSRLFSTRAKLRLLKEPFIRPANPDAEETLAEFVERRLGREFLDIAIDAFVAGVFAGRPEDLSVRAAFPRLHALEQQYGSLIKGTILGARERRKRKEKSKQGAVSLSFKQGLETLVRALAQGQAKRLQLNTKISLVRQKEAGFVLDLDTGGQPWHLESRALVFAVPAHAYQGLDFDFEFSLKSRLADIPYPPVTGVFFGYNHQPAGRPMDGFGFLVPRREKRHILGTLWNSSTFSNRACQGGAALTTMVGGTRQPEQALMADAALIAAVRRDLRELMGIEARPDEVFIQRWPRAIPQYQVGHEEIIAAVAAFERQHPGLYISGNFRGGIGVPDCLKQAYAISERLVGELAP